LSGDVNRRFLKSVTVFDALGFPFADSAHRALEFQHMEHRMNRLASLALIAVTTLAGCSGGGTVPGPTAATATATAADSGFSSSPYQVPVVTDPSVEGAQRNPAGERIAQNSFGGIPGSALLTDATNFPPGSQANFAIVSVSAVSAQSSGVTYPIVQYWWPVIVNVLDFQNSDLLLGTNIVPAIQYSGVQYVIDPTKSSVVINGKTYPMSLGTMANNTFTPLSNGYAALYFPDPVKAGTSPNFLVDFNAANWITIKNGVAVVVPQGAGTTLSQDAEIDGKILNKAGGPVSNAVVSAYGPDGVIVNSGPSGSDGTFHIHAISGNGYSLVVWNTYAPVSSIIVSTATGNDPLGWSINGPFVNVPAGYTVNVGTIRD
jgi:hypothetical protein